MGSVMSDYQEILENRVDIAADCVLDALKTYNDLRAKGDSSVKAIEKAYTTLHRAQVLLCETEDQLYACRVRGD